MDRPDWQALVAEARNRLAGRVVRTPLLESPSLAVRAGGQVFLKAESLQETGSFKFRPALNGVLAFEAEARTSGTVASSSGNFAAAVARAAASIGARSTIVMTPDASSYKVRRTESFGGRVVFCEARYESRQETVDAIRRATGAVELHPHSSPETIAGDATLALEILDQCPRVSTVIAPASGGGLVAGLALGFRLAGSAAKVVAVQPEGSTAFVESFRRGVRWTAPRVETLADGLMAKTPGDLAFRLAKDHVASAFVVGESSLPPAVRHLAFEEKLVVEPSGATGLAALMEAADGAFEPPIVVVLSGGNIAPDRLAALLTPA